MLFLHDVSVKTVGLNLKGEERIKMYSYLGAPELPLVW